MICVSSQLNWLIVLQIDLLFMKEHAQVTLKDVHLVDDGKRG